MCKKYDIQVGCAWCQWGIIKLLREDIIKTIQEHPQEEGKIFGGYVCNECLKREEKKGIRER